MINYFRNNKEAFLQSYLCPCGSELEIEEFTDEDIVEAIEALPTTYITELEAIKTTVEYIEFSNRQRENKLGIYQVANEDFSFRSLEGILDTLRHHKLEAISYLAKRIMIKSFNLGIKTLLFVTSKSADISKNSKGVAKYWSMFIGAYMPFFKKIDLQEIDINMLPSDRLIKAIEVVKMGHRFCGMVDATVMDSGANLLSSTAKDIESKFRSIGVDISMKNNLVNSDDLDDSRRYASLADLGYDMSYMPNLANHNKILVSISSENDNKEIVRRFDDCARHISNEMTSLNNLLDSKKLAKNSPEYDKRMNRIITMAGRYSFCNLVLHATYMVALTCSSDIMKLFRVLEKHTLTIKEKEED